MIEQASSCPRSVTPGTENQTNTIDIPEPGMYVGLDWIRCTGPKLIREHVLSWLCKTFGSDYKRHSGAKFFKGGFIWEPGILLSLGHNAGVLQVDIQGQRLRLIDGHGQISLLRNLMQYGLSPTRIDGAIDWIGQSINICESALRSCENKELCRLRNYEKGDKLTATGQYIKRMVKLGNRDSPICARIYDKGLEQNAAPVGDWERLEVEWKKDRASQLAIEMIHAGENWPNHLIRMIYGAVSFHQVNGRSELDRRPLSPWWQQLIQDHSPIRITPAYEDQSFEKWRAWFRVACGSRLAEFAEATGYNVGEIVQWLITDIKPGINSGPILKGMIQTFKRQYQK